MGFRFQKRIKLMPGLTLNLSRKGVSTSLGTTGARVTLGHGQRRITTGIPGSGLSHTEITTNKSIEKKQAASRALYATNSELHSTRATSTLSIIASFFKSLLGK